MDYDDVVMLIRAGDDGDGLVRLCAALGSGDRLTINGLLLRDEPAIDPVSCFAIGEAAVGSVLDDIAEATTRLTDAAEAAFRAALMRHDRRGRWVYPHLGEVSWETARRIRCFDLAVVRRREGGHADRLLDTLILESGTPCLVLPPAADGPGMTGHVVLAWDGSREARNAVQAALPLLRHAEKISMVSIDNESESALASEGDDMVRHLLCHGVTARWVRLSPGDRSIGDSLLEHCVATGADLLVMGGYHHRPMRERILGGATRTALGHAGMAVLIAH